MPSMSTFKININHTVDLFFNGEDLEFTIKEQGEELSFQSGDYDFTIRKDDLASVARTFPDDIMAGRITK